MVRVAVLGVGRQEQFLLQGEVVAPVLVPVGEECGACLVDRCGRRAPQPLGHEQGDMVVLRQRYERRLSLHASASSEDRYRDGVSTSWPRYAPAGRVTVMAPMT